MTFPSAPASFGFRLQHVQLAIPLGSEDACRRFYIDVLGLTEVPKPPALAVRGNRLEFIAPKAG